MSRAKSLLELHLSQAELALQKVANNSYSDKRKQDYQNKLSDLFKAIEEKILADNPTDEAIIYGTFKQHLDFIFKSLEFLDSSTLNQIPYEIVECLDSAMKDWTSTTENYLIVTSLINDVGGFSFDRSLVYSDSIYADIQKHYGITFEYKLVQINVPSALNRDYLAAVVLYHELGHFIDVVNNISHRIIETVIDKIQRDDFTDDEKRELTIYFPFLKPYFLDSTLISDINNEKFILYHHTAEYFCDLFASQYIGEASSYYLTYLTSAEYRYSETHPSTTNRVKVVSDFLGSTDNLIVRIISEAIESITLNKLERRYDSVDQSDFFQLVPIKIETERELHGIYEAVWSIWLHETTKMNTAIGNSKNSALKVYKVLNNLVEKSIGNYITINRWKTAKLA